MFFCWKFCPAIFLSLRQLLLETAAKDEVAISADLHPVFYDKLPQKFFLRFLESKLIWSFFCVLHQSLKTVDFVLAFTFLQNKQ